MKNKILTLGMIMLSACAIAQLAPPPPAQTPGGNTSTAEGTSAFKPSSGDLTFELNFAPFAGSPLSLNYLRARYFLSDDLALRAGFSIAMRGGSSNNKSFEYALLPGIEKHFGGTERLSPYVGAELVIAGRSSSGSVTSTVSTGTGTAATISTTVKDTKGAWDGGSNVGFFNFGINAVVGCDFYFSKHIYMGLEAGLGFNSVKSSDVTVTTTINGTGTTATSKGGSNFQFGPNFNSAIRLGFVF